MSYPSRTPRYRSFERSAPILLSLFYMKKTKTRAVAAVADGIHSLGQIARRASVSKGTLAQWIQDPELRARMRAQKDLYDEWLRARTRRLMPRALKALEWILSPSTPSRAKVWAITTVLRLNGYGNDVRGLGSPGMSTAGRRLNGEGGGERGNVSNCLPDKFRNLFSGSFL